MRRRFRDWTPKGELRIKYRDENGEVAYWEVETRYITSKIRDIADKYMAKKIKLTNRQLYYQLVGEAIIPNALEIYKRICKLMTDMRYAGLLDWDAIEDRGRVPTMHSEWEDIQSLIESACNAYRLPRWKDEEFYVELYCEKEAMESILKPIADKYHIYFGYNKGYSSASAMYELSKRLKRKIKKGKIATVLYLGDFDPSGRDMVRDIRDRVDEFLGHEYNFEVVPLALTMKQIRKYNPPPNPAKISDPRAGEYIKTYGNVSWELDSLPPEVLMDIAEEGIRDYLHVGRYNAFIAREDKEKKILEDFGESLR